MPERPIPRTYNVRVEVHQIHNCRFSEGGKDILPNPYVEVCVGRESRVTSKRQQAASASFDTQFNFTTVLTVEEFALAAIEVSAYHAYMLTSALIGSVGFSYTHVYNQQQHLLYRQWVTLRNSGSPADPVGHLLISIGVFGPGDAIPVVEDTSVGGGSSLARGGSLAEGQAADLGRVARMPDIKYQSYTLNISVYRGQDIAPLPVAGGVLTAPIVRVGHGGAKEVTRVLTGSSPEWNTTIRLPAFIPSYDDNVLIELGHASSDTSFTPLGIAGLRLGHLISQPQPATWLNFYWRPPKGDLVENVGMWFGTSTTWSTGNSALPPTLFAGRLLVSAMAQKVQTASPKCVCPASNVPEPQVTEYVFYADVYEITPMSGNAGRIEVEIAIGPFRRCTPSMEFEGGSYLCDGSLGRVDAVKLYLPPLQQVYDVFLYVIGTATQGTLFTGGRRDRLAFVRIPLRDCLAFDTKPTWYTLQSVENGYPAFSILATLHCGPTSEAPEKRSDRLTYNLKSFLFRPMIYEGMNMPCISRTGFPTCYVKVELGGRCVQTRVVPFHLNPAWYEAFEIMVCLPDNLTLAPDVNVEVLTQDDKGYSGAPVSLGYFNFPLRRIPVCWEAYPEWQPLKFGTASQFVQHNKGRILCSFELLSDDPGLCERYPFYDDIRPTTFPSTLHFFLLGIRMFKPAQSPEVTVSYGRDFVNPEKPLWEENAGPPRSGHGGNWNFLKETTLEVALPKRYIHNATLEMTIRDSTTGFGGERKVTLGNCYIPLTSSLPWLTESERAEAADTFKVWTLEDALLEAADQPITFENQLAQDDDTESLHPVGKSAKDKSRKLLVPYNNSDRANTQIYDALDHLAFNEAAEAQKEAALMKKLAKVTRTPFFDKDASPEDLVRNPTTAITQLPLNNEWEDTMKFELILPDDNLREEERREEITHEFEADVETSYLPYRSVPILQSTESGVPETVGYVKYLCAVYLPGKDEEARNAFIAAIQWMTDQYALTRELVIRAYILSARGLIPPSGDSDPGVYVWIENDNSASNGSGTGDLSHNIKDSGNVRRQGFRPEFNKCYSLHCALPDYAILKISLMNTGKLREEVIGSTHIDLEDRWFNPKYQLVLLQDTVPIEQRTLKLEGRIESQGSLRIWVEILTSETAQAKPTAVLASPDPEDFQLRMIVWRVKGIPLEDNASVSLFVRGTYQLTSSTFESQDTDVHYNSRDGTGRFNWRFVWDTPIPAQYPSLKFLIFNSHLLQAGEPVAECNIDLGYDFAAARRRNSSKHVIPISWYSCTHPGFSGQVRGMIQVEGVLLPAKEAAFAPVGKGREPPNRDPFLEAVTENRTYVDWKYVGEQVASVTTSMMANARYICILTAAILIIGGILFLVILLR